MDNKYVLIKLTVTVNSKCYLIVSEKWLCIFCNLLWPQLPCCVFVRDRVYHR